jgi:hypothetical protein
VTVNEKKTNKQIPGHEQLTRRASKKVMRGYRTQYIHVITKLSLDVRQSTLYSSEEPHPRNCDIADHRIPEDPRMVHSVGWGRRISYV